MNYITNEILSLVKVALNIELGSTKKLPEAEQVRRTRARERRTRLISLHFNNIIEALRTQASKDQAPTRSSQPVLSAQARKAA